jgi:DNA-binding transcriptional LysR family regulator
MNSSRNVNDLAAFFAVAREKSFTRGGTVGVTQSALSHTIRGLEQRLGDASKDQA